METITIKGTEFTSAGDAIQHTDASGRGVVITIGGKFLVVERAEADRIAATGASFAYLTPLEREGRTQIVTVPVH